MDIELQRYTDPATFRDAIDDYLSANIATCSQLFVNTRSLTQEQVRDRQSWLVRLHRSGQTCGMAMINTAPPLRTVSLSPMDEDGVACVAAALAADGIEVNGVFGTVQSATSLAAQMGLFSGERARMGNHVLDVPPIVVPCPGRMRAATLDDYDLLLAWEQAFVLECGLPDNRATLPAEIMERLTGAVTLMWLWEIDDTPVAMVW